MRHLLLLLLLALAGCAGLHHAPPGAEVMVVENPLFVPAGNCDFIWNQVIDTLDNYFKTERMEPVRLVDGILTEGRIETYYQTGATYLEPWRSDSSPGYERLHATLQSIRRKAIVTLSPTQGGFWLQVAVAKELEDLDRPERATVSGPLERTDNSFIRDPDVKPGGATTLGWIPLGRDASLEQRILVELRARLFDPAPGGALISAGQPSSPNLPGPTVPAPQIPVP